ncbi:MAG: MaoC family dehydratase [Chloroflexota bacterium]|nr:MAG: MaoC family dehydratase [Chloroflexota bacterium]
MTGNYQVRVDFNVGEKAEMTKEITENDITSMAEITGDFNPIHIDEDFAKKTRFKGCIAHGVLSNGLISAVLGMHLPGPGAIYLGQTLKYLNPVRAGDTLRAEVEVSKWRPDKKIIHLETRCLNQHNDIIVEGEAVMLIETIE